MKSGALLTAFGALGVAACASVTSNMGDKRDDPLTGVAYMVPTQRITVTATRVDSRAVKLDKALTNWVKAETALSAANAALVLAEKALKEANEALEAYTGSNDAYKAQLKLAQEKAKIAFNQANDAKTDANTANTTAREYVAKLQADRLAGGAPNEPRWVETLKLVASQAIGDPNLQFAASPEFNALRSDEGALTISNGLLQSADVTTSGEVDEILVSAFRAASIFGAGFLSPTETFSLTATGDKDPATKEDEQVGDDERTTVPVSECTAEGNKDPAEVPIHSRYKLRPNTTNLSFDPSNERDIFAANMALCQSGYSLRLRVDLNGETIGNEVSSGAPTDSAAAYKPPTLSENELSPREELEAEVEQICETVPSYSCGGLVYRTPRAFDFRVIQVVSETEKFLRHQQTLSLVSGAPLRLLEYEASPFTTVNNDAKFQAGVLVSYEYDRPGAVDEFANIPFRAANAAAEAISNLVQLRLNITDDTKDIQKLEAEIANLASTENAANELSIAEQQLEMLKVQKQILEIQADIDTLNQTGDTP